MSMFYTHTHTLITFLLSLLSLFSLIHLSVSSIFRYIFIRSLAVSFCSPCLLNLLYFSRYTFWYVIIMIFTHSLDLTIFFLYVCVCFKPSDIHRHTLLIKHQSVSLGNQQQYGRITPLMQNTSIELYAKHILSKTHSPSKFHVSTAFLVPSHQDLCGLRSSFVLYTFSVITFLGNLSSGILNTFPKHFNSPLLIRLPGFLLGGYYIFVGPLFQSSDSVNSFLPWQSYFQT